MAAQRANVLIARHRSWAGSHYASDVLPGVTKAV
jgi:hypothetical protein